MTHGTWLRTVRSREKSAGVDHRQFACYASTLTPHVRDHLARAAQGIEKLYGQLPAATVSEADQREHWTEGREAYIDSIRDVLGHLAAALTAVGCTDKQLALGDPGEEGIPAEVPEEPDGPDDAEEDVVAESDPEKTVAVPISAVKVLAVGDLKKKSR